MEARAAEDPGGYVPVRSAAPLILRLEDPFQYLEESSPELRAQKAPSTPRYLVHVKRHGIRAGEDAVLVGLQEVGPAKLPLRGRYSDEDIWEGGQPYLINTVMKTCVLLSESFCINHNNTILVHVYERHLYH